MTKSIVVVDDDAFILKIASKILLREEYDVCTLRSGAELLELCREKRPDMILMDINMPEMDGFETLAVLRRMEKEQGMVNTPVIFLTADNDGATETHGFEMGVSDYITKPFSPDVFLKRIENVLSANEQLRHFINEAAIDKLTGLYNKGAATEKFVWCCENKTGFLLMIDLDSFKLVNDIYGHEAGDSILKIFSELIKKNLGKDDVIGRMGGDEFSAFSFSISDENDLKHFTDTLNREFLGKAKDILGDGMNIFLGASVGAVKADGRVRDYFSLIKLADSALYDVKKNGKHDCRIYEYEAAKPEIRTGECDLKTLSMMLSERNVSNSALHLGLDEFISVYRFVMRYIMRYNTNACKVLFTIDRADGADESGFENACRAFEEHTGKHLRKSDLMMQYKMNQIFVLLTDIREEAVERVIGNIMGSWNDAHAGSISITYESEYVRADDLEPVHSRNYHGDNAVPEE